jgi:group II intron reverse transcriptase/maturase
MQGSQSVSTKLERIAKLAREAPDMSFTSLSHHIDLDWFEEAYRLTRKDGAPGIDGRTADEYAINKRENLLSLKDRAKSGMYRAPPVKRVEIPKGDGKQTRPIGIPTFEDKVLQRAVAMALEAVYEQDFLDCSHGFRPGRSAHGALESLWKQAMDMGGGWLLEVDVRKFFDNLDHQRMQELLGRRVRDGVIKRLIGKWLNAGVLDGGVMSYPTKGTPQGGVISPLLANIYLHEVLDVWFEREVKPRLKGRAFLVRYADDFVMCFELETDARRVLEVLPKRFGSFGLELHPEKTRLLEFRSPQVASSSRSDDEDDGPGSFSFLGFTHFWAKSQKGNWIVKRKTAKDRFARSVRNVNEWCRRHRHDPIKTQWGSLSAKLRGHFGYFGGIIGNSKAIDRFRRVVTAVWRRWLNRRSQRRSMPWEKMTKLLERWPLPIARVTYNT